MSFLIASAAMGILMMFGIVDTAKDHEKNQRIVMNYEFEKYSNEIKLSQLQEGQRKTEKRLKRINNKLSLLQK